MQTYLLGTGISINKGQLTRVHSVLIIKAGRFCWSQSDWTAFVNLRVSRCHWLLFQNVNVNLCLGLRMTRGLYWLAECMYCNRMLRTRWSHEDLELHKPWGCWRRHTAVDRAIRRQSRPWQEWSRAEIHSCSRSCSTRAVFHRAVRRDEDSPL